MVNNESEEGGFEAQLASLYGERESLQRELGTADSEEVIQMFKNFEAQLKSLYQEREAGGGAGGSSNDAAVDEILSLRTKLGDSMRPEITFEAAEGRRSIRAVWKAA
jgi:hypothetical protein